MSGGPVPDTRLEQALALHQRGELQAAGRIYRDILALEPAHADALHLLGVVAHQMNANDTALQLVQRAIALEPGRAHYYSNLSYICTALKRLDEGLAAARQALALQPANVEAMINLGNALKELGQMEEALRCFADILRLQPDYLHAHSNLLFGLQYASGRSQAELALEHRRFAQRFEAPLVAARQPHAQAAEPGRRLRVGYLSPDLREHPVAYYLEPVLQHHDRANFELTAYADQVQVDGFTQRLASLCEHWVPCKGLSDEALAQRIRDDGIDILVDLAGHTADNRLAVFARKPAPVQVTWLGYVASTGLQAMDWRLGHVDTDLPGQEAWYSEQIHRFERCLWWVYRPRAGMPGPTPAPVERHGRIRFGSTNNIGKLNAPVIAAWAQILLRVADSELVLAGIPQGSAARALTAQFEAHGVAASRLVLMGKLSPPQFWALHAELDLILDPFPYNGGATTCDALWLGVPVLALQGESFVARMGHAMLRCLGLGDWSAPDIAAYIEAAVRQAHDRPRLAALRASLRARVERSALRDETGFTRELEAFYRMAWQRWCASRPPAQAHGGQVAQGGPA